MSKEELEIKLGLFKTRVREIQSEYQSYFNSENKDELYNLLDVEEGALSLKFHKLNSKNYPDNIKQDISEKTIELFREIMTLII